MSTMDSDILLVDDDPDAIKLLRRILAGEGNLRFAINGEDALRLARRVAPDLMLLDAEMPGMSGLQVFDALKADPELAGVAVIFITSRSEPAFTVWDLDSGGRGNSNADSGRTALLRARFVADDLLLAADKALYSAKIAGRAQAKLLDIADLYSPHLARDIAPLDFAL